MAGLILNHPPPPGDIAFRFLESVRYQQEKQRRRAARSIQAPSWQHADPDNSAEEAGPAQSRAVVCDINKEMLSVGKQKADNMGLHSGMFLGDQGSYQECLAVNGKKDIFK